MWSCSSIHVFRGGCRFEGGWCLSVLGCRVVEVDGGIHGVGVGSVGHTGEEQGVASHQLCPNARGDRN